MLCDKLSGEEGGRKQKQRRNNESTSQRVNERTRQRKNKRTTIIEITIWSKPNIKTSKQQNNKQNHTAALETSLQTHIQDTREPTN